MNNLDPKLPIEFYYEELSRYLLNITSATQKRTAGIGLSKQTASSIQSSFIDSLKESGISAEDCLRTLYAIRLRRNAKTRNPLKKSEVKFELIDSLVRHYHSSRFCPPFQDEVSTKSDIKQDFPSLVSLNADEKQIEGKSFSDDSRVHSIQQMFIESYRSEASKATSVLKDHPLKRIRTFKKVAKNLRYRDTEGMLKKAKLALATTVLASAIALGGHLITSPTRAREVHEPITNGQELDNFAEKASDRELLSETVNQIYSEPEKLQDLGFSEETSRNFDTFIRYSNADDLTPDQQSEYERISNELISTFNIHQLETSGGSIEAPVYDCSVSSNISDYASITYKVTPEDRSESNVRFIKVDPNSDIVLSSVYREKGDFRNAVLCALRGSLCPLRFDPELGYYETFDASAFDKATSSTAEIPTQNQDIDR